MASFGHGAAGVAYFLLRCSAATGDTQWLAWAGSWAARAEAAVDTPGAFTGEPPVFPDARAAIPASVYFGEAGVWCCGVLVATAQGDAAAVERRLGQFVRVAEACPPERPDVVSGAAGLLLATAGLVEQSSPSSPGRLLATGERLATRLSRIAAAVLRQGAGASGWLGAAHGWSGIAHALLRWAQATESEAEPDTRALLDALRALRRPDGFWPRNTGSAEVWPGWCHGSAGWTQLWTLAADVLADDEWLDLAVAVGRDTVSATDTAPGLCCGDAGSAYAALALYRATGDGAWLDHAHRLAARASAAVPDATFPPDSLWQGDLGVALLQVELAQPDSAAFPLYQRP